LEQLTHAQMQRLAIASGVPFTTLWKVRSGTTTNPGIETVGKFLPYIDDVLRGSDGVAAPAKAAAAQPPIAAPASAGLARPSSEHAAADSGRRTHERRDEDRRTADRRDMQRRSSERRQDGGGR